MNNYRFDGIQALRFLAAAMVLVMHSFFYASERLGAENLYWEAGAKGVDIFFVISGFVMVISSRNLTGSTAWRIFLRKRIIRIVPLYWTATTFKLIIMLLASGVVLHANLDWWIIFKSYFFIPSYNLDGQMTPFLGVGWTLVYEMFFYLIFSIALYTKRNIYLFVGAILLIFSALSLFREKNYSVWWFLMNPIVLEFYFGMIIGYFTLKKTFQPSPLFSVSVFSLSAAYLVLSNDILGAPRFIENGIPSALLVWSVISFERFLRGKIPKVIMFLGAASYAIYLFHPLTAPLAPEILKRISMGNFIISILFSVIIAITISSIVHRWFEQPLTILLHKKNLTNSSADR